MPSTFFGLNTAYLGLSAANASLNTTANNVSNVETEGYSRQYTVQTAADAIRTFTSYGCAGAGVEVLAIERYRNEFYDEKYWNNQSYLGEYTTKEYYMKQIESYFVDEPDQLINGFNTLFDAMYAALADVKKDSGTSDTREAFVGTAENLTEYFNTMAGNLQKLQKDMNEEIKINVDRINALAQEIVTLNKQINVVELSGANSNANELRDRRALLIDQLSEIVDVETEEQPMIDPYNPDRVTGATRFIVRIAGGQVLIDDSNSYSLQCVARESYEKVNQSDVDGLYDIVWSNGNKFSLTNASMGGKLVGLVNLRDGNNAEYFNGTVTNVVKSGNNTIATVAVTADYLKDLNKTTLPDNGGQIMIGNKMIYFDSWTFNYDADTDTYSYDFVLSDESKNGDISLTGLNNKEASVGYKMDYQGIPYYMEQMNEWIRCFAKNFNDIMTQNGSIDNYGDPAQNFFLANKATDDGQWAFKDDFLLGQSFSISPSSDSYYKLTALNFAVSAVIEKDPNRMATHTGNADEESRYDVVDELIDLKTNVNRMNFRGSSASGFLQCVLSDIALNAQKANNFSQNYDNISKSIQTQRLSVSGVDEDEEALNLVKYENAYKLASKMIQTLTEVYDRLILQTGV